MHPRFVLLLAVAALFACGDSGPTETAAPLLDTDPASLDFGVIDVDESSGVLVVTVENAGTAALDEPIVTITGPASADFAVDSSYSTCPGAVLEVDETCTLEVWFEPATGGARAATLTIRGEGVEGATVALAGTGAGLVTAAQAGTGSGTIASDPSGILCGDACAANFAVPATLTATPDEDSYFVGWSGACTGAGECVVPVGESATVTATFARFPETSFTALPLAKTNQPSASWSFTGERAASFECSLDGGAFAPCASPYAITSFPPGGTSTLRVRAVDAAGQADPSPAEHSASFTVAPLLDYPFESGTTNTGALDGYHGTSGSVTYPAGKQAKSIKFDGSATTGTTLAGTAALLGGGHEWTISLWFREDVPKANTELLGFRSIGGWHTYHGVDGTQLTTCSPGGCFSFSSVLGSWRHLLFRYDGESPTVGGPLEIWLDGVLAGTIANPDKVPLTAGALRDIALGVDDPYRDGGLFYVDEVRVFNAVFTPEVQCARAMAGTWTGTSCTLP